MQDQVGFKGITEQIEQIRIIIANAWEHQQWLSKCFYPSTLKRPLIGSCIAVHKSMKSEHSGSAKLKKVRQYEELLGGKENEAESD